MRGKSSQTPRYELMIPTFTRVNLQIKLANTILRVDTIRLTGIYENITRCEIVLFRGGIAERAPFF